MRRDAHESGLLDKVFAAMVAAPDRWLSPAVDSIPPELGTGETNDLGWVRWSPMRASTAPAALEAFHGILPGRLPALFEELLLSYRWLRVEVAGVELFANPPGADLRGFMEEITRDPHLCPPLFADRLIEVGKAVGGSYDPICFDLKRGRARDCPMVRVDHESVLLSGRPKVISEVAPSFRMFVERLAP